MNVKMKATLAGAAAALAMASAPMNSEWDFIAILLVPCRHTILDDIVIIFIINPSQLASNLDRQSANNPLAVNLLWIHLISCNLEIPLLVNLLIILIKISNSNHSKVGSERQQILNQQHRQSAAGHFSEPPAPERIMYNIMIMTWWWSAESSFIISC